MYWRFGHQNASVIDHLLESGNVSLEELLEQDDLIQECKAQNPKLIEYLRDPIVLQQLLSYITSDDLEDRARFKYPFIACEVIACEVWGIFESALSNVDMLVKFWEFLDRPPPLNPVQASYFAKVIGVFLMKKTNEMLQFIKSQPEVVPKLLLHMSTSAIMDLLLKIISMEESPEGKGTVQWLSEQGLMPWLVNRLDPNFDAEVHSIASQVLLDIIAISQSSHPEQPSIGTNVLIDELKSEVLVSQLVGFMLDRDAPYSSSTLINGVTIFIELIRRNNSDYDVEPLPPGSTEPVREAVDLSDLLKVLASRIEDFKNLLIVPRSATGPIDTSIGKQTPLGFERLKICEMFAELLHCSNMAVLNSRPIISVSADGTVKIPTVSINTLHRQHSSDETANAKSEGVDEEMADRTADAAEEVRQVHTDANHSQKSAKLQNGIPTPTGSTGDDTTAVHDDLATPRASPPLKPTTSTLASSIIASLVSTNHGHQDDVLIPVGDFLKLQFVDHRIIPTCFDLFFQFPWNNFLHTVVYDMVHQVFHRPMGDIGRPDVDGTYIPPRSDQDITEGWNRRLTISIFKDGQLTKRITDAQRLNDYECAQPKGVRLGYMGHLTYIADETVKLLELYSQTSLLSTLYEFIDLEDWWNYVSKILKETKERDAQVLGGTRPNVIESHNKSGLDDGHDDDDYMDDNDEDYGGSNGGGNDFLAGGGSGAGHEGDVASDQFARYLCQQITNNLPDKFDSSDEDEDEEEGNWIGEYGADNEFDMRRTGGASDGMGDPFSVSHAMDFDSDDEEGVDEETWNAPWPSASFAENKSTELGPADSNASVNANASTETGAAQFNATLTELSDESQDGASKLKTGTTATTAATTVPPGEDSVSKHGSSTQQQGPNQQEAENVRSTTNASATIPASVAASSPSGNNASTTTSAACANNTADASNTHAHDDEEITVRVPAPVPSTLVSQGPVSVKEADVDMDGSASSTSTAEIVSKATKEQPKDAEMEAVALAPVVQETPDVKGTLVAAERPHAKEPLSSISSTASDSSARSISSTVVEPPSSISSISSESFLIPKQQAHLAQKAHALTMDMDVVPLADPEEPKLHVTRSLSTEVATTSSSTTNNKETSKDTKEDAAVTNVTAKVAGLGLKKQ